MDYRDLINEAQMIMGENIRQLPGGSEDPAIKKLEDAKAIREIIITDYKKLKKTIRDEDDRKLVDVLKDRLGTLRVAIIDEDADKADKLANELFTINDERNKTKINALHDQLTNDNSKEGKPEEEKKNVKDPEGSTGMKPPSVTAGSKKTQEKYKMDDSQPLESVVIALRSIYDVGTMPGKQESKTFHSRITKTLANKESSNERHMKKVANKFYDRFFIKEENAEQKKLDNKMGELINYTRNEAHRRLLPKLKKLLTDNDKRKALTSEKGTIAYLYDSLVLKAPYTSYVEAKNTAEVGKVEEYIKSCIYQRLYYIFIMYRFATAIGEISILANPNQAVKYCEIKKLDNKQKGTSAEDPQSNFGTETNVKNIFNQALTQVLQLDTADMTTMESSDYFLEAASKFLNEDPYSSLGIDSDGTVNNVMAKGMEIGKSTVKAVTDTATTTSNDNSLRTLNIMRQIPKRHLNTANKNKVEITKYPQVLADFIGLMASVFKKKGFSYEKFNTIATANELNKVDKMATWLSKNKNISKDNYLKMVIDYMVYAKMNGPGGDPSWGERFLSRHPGIARAGKAYSGTKKVVGATVGGIKSGLGKLI